MSLWRYDVSSFSMKAGSDCCVLLLKLNEILYLFYCLLQRPAKQGTSPCFGWCWGTSRYFGWFRRTSYCFGWFLSLHFDRTDSTFVSFAGSFRNNSHLQHATIGACVGLHQFFAGKLGQECCCAWPACFFKRYQPGCAVLDLFHHVAGLRCCL